MIEILWHGRGGQGAFTAARLLGAAAALEQGRYALAFPSFGPERRGAPMRAFTKVGERPIGDRSAIKRADYVIYLDETLLADGWDAELKEGGRVLVNSARTFDDARIVPIDANSISQRILGRPIPNTVFLGALTVLVEGLSEANVKQAIRLYMPEKLHGSNERIVDEARAELLARGAGERAGVAAGLGEGLGGQAGADDGAASDSAPAAATAEDAAEAADRAAVEAAWRAHGTTPRPAAHIPTLQHDELDPARYARTTCFSAGHLVSMNAGWRNRRPVVDYGACTGCLQCYLYCPDGAIFKAAPPEGARRAADVVVDYDFCKGCGVCVRACRFGAVRMVPEPLALQVEARLASASAADPQPAKEVRA